jgi:hypothetical protein
MGFLPFVAFLSVFFITGNVFRDWGWRRAFVRSFLLVGSYMVLANEALSLIDWITPAALTVVWALPILLAIGWTGMAYRRGVRIEMPAFRSRLTVVEWVLVAGVAVIAATVMVVAWIAPPNTWDSLTYHMSRVAHWAQNASLRPYATGIERQNFMSPVAEIGMLQVYVLGSGDRLVNFIEWISMVVSIVAATLVARDLGSNRMSQLFAAVFVVTLPMGIAQASSTMTDYVVAVWFISLCCEAVLLAKGVPGAAPAVFASVAAGLTIGTKPTGFAYLLPFCIFIAIALIWRRGIRETMRYSLVAVVIVLMLNAGYFERNVALYGNPLGRARSVEGHSNEILDWRVVVSNTLRNASLHAGTPYKQVNDALYLALAKLHVKLGLDLTDPRTSIHPDFLILKPSTDETRAGNLLQAILILIAFILAGVFYRKVGALAAGLSLTVAATFVVLSVMFKFTVFGSRYHLGFFVAYAPLVAYVMGRLVPRSVLALLGIGLIIAARQWVVGVEPRPLIPQPGSAYASILQVSRTDQYLSESQMKVYREMTNKIAGDSCSSVGIMISGNAPEYPLWPLMGAPRDDLKIEWIVGGTASARYEDPNFQPCAVICDESCPGETQSVRGLPLAYDASGYRLFLRSETVASP